jgi:dienelactone hydrolase
MRLGHLGSFPAILEFVAERRPFELPHPTGPLPVGTTTFAVSRPPDAGEALPGRFWVQVWYPGQASTERAPYGNGSRGLKGWMYRHLVTAHAAPDVGMAALPRRAPVLVYVAGWGNDRGDNTALLEELASHGFVVAALADVSLDDPPPKRLGGPADFRSERAYEATLRLGSAKLAYAARRVCDVLDRLEELDAGDPDGRFTARLDLANAGILGYSFGGAVALQACRRDGRLRAVLNMDGWLFDSAEGYSGGLTYFLMSDNLPAPGPEDLNSTDPEHRYTSLLKAADEERQRAVLQLGGFELRIDAADHLSFTDVPLYAPLHRFATGSPGPELISRTIREYAVAFFELELNGRPSPLLTPGCKRDPDMTLASWPATEAR